MTLSPELHRVLMLDKLHAVFSESVSVLPDYRRSAVWEYVKALRAVIEDKDAEINRLSNEIIKMIDNERKLDTP